jgi:hypothetical protein
MTKKREELMVRVTYEPNRLSSTYLMDAYELIASTTHISRPTKSTEGGEPSGKPTIFTDGE